MVKFSKLINKLKIAIVFTIPIFIIAMADMFEKNPLKTIPTMASVVARVPLLMNCGFDYTKVLHA
mgnify:CR=1 FL=1